MYLRCKQDVDELLKWDVAVTLEELLDLDHYFKVKTKFRYSILFYSI